MQRVIYEARLCLGEQALSTEDGANLLIAYRRASNIVEIEQKKRDWTPGAVENGRLRQSEEREAIDQLAKVELAARSALFRGEFDAAMTALASLRQPVDEFFAKVTVNTDDPALRENRLRLLSRIRAVMNQVADFSQIEG